MPQYEDVYDPPMLDSTGQAIASAIQGLNPTIPAFISDAFSVERSYSAGDITIYENKVYIFTSSKSAGAWDSTKVTETTIGAICSATNSSLAQLEGDVNVTAKQGITLMRSTISRSGALVGGTLDFKLTASANAWIDIGDIDLLPTSMAQVPCVNTSNALFGGLIQITTGGVIRLYPPTAINNAEISFTINYKCVLS